MRSVAITAVIVAQAKAFPSSLVYPHNCSSSASGVQTFNQNVNRQWRLCAVCSRCCVADRRLTADHFRLGWNSIHFEFEFFVLLKLTKGNRISSAFVNVSAPQALHTLFRSSILLCSQTTSLDYGECSLNRWIVIQHLHQSNSICEICLQCCRSIRAHSFPCVACARETTRASATENPYLPMAWILMIINNKTVNVCRRCPFPREHRTQSK